MLSRVEVRKKIGGNSSNVKLLNEIGTINKALYLDKNRPSKPARKTDLPEPKSKLKNSDEDPLPKEKKSIWNWNPLKAFLSVGNRRFACCFSLRVHSIVSLPVSFNDLSLCVHWKRRDGDLVTRPANVFNRIAEFEEQLSLTCTVYSVRSGLSAKYEAKHCLVYASLSGTPDLDLGKHRVDLARILPHTLEELEEEKSSGKWTTSFKLSGKAKGAVMNVSFGYMVVGDNPARLGDELSKMKQNNRSIGIEATKFRKATLRRVESLPSSVKIGAFGSSPLHLPKPELDVTNTVDRNFDKDKSDASAASKPESDVLTEHFEHVGPPASLAAESSKEYVENESEDIDFSVVEKGMELSSQEQATLSTVKSPRVVESNRGIGVNFKECSWLVMQGFNPKEDDQCSKESLMNNANYQTIRKVKSFSLDAAAESVASEFLNLLGIDDSEPESPRERLLREFEKDTLTSGCSLFDFDMFDGKELESGFIASTPSGCRSSNEDFDFSPVIQDTEQEHQVNGRNKTRAKVLEDLETEALMREWGLNEKAFQRSLYESSGGFGSPVTLPPEDPLEPPPLGDGLGPFLQTKNGGFLRSMNPSIFRGAKGSGSLIMQVSSPVVLPAEMGSGIMDILQGLASVGIEKLSMQANKLMPLDDIACKTLEQVAWEAALTLDGPESQCLLQHDFEVDLGLSSRQKKAKRSPRTYSNKLNSPSIDEMGLEYVSLEGLAPLAMDKIEALSMEGLRIQSGMSDEDAPSNINAKSIGEIPALQGKGFDMSGCLGLEGTAGLQLLDVKDTGDNVDGLMGLSLTLDEWMRLDSGDIDDGDQISERTSKILAAHHATSLESVRRGPKGEKKRGKKCGLLGNNFTVALMVQLRDPMRNYEPVGAPMLALIQVERVFITPKPKIYSTVSIVGNDDSKSAAKEVKTEETKEEKASQEEGIPRFRIADVHVAGLKTEAGKKKLWGSTAQQQSGSRWLLANGMAKNNKLPLMKSKVQPGDTLWSVSSRVHGAGEKRKASAAVNPHIRNPSIILPR